MPVHPRVCGEQALIEPFFGSSAGSSPRVRGTEKYTRETVMPYRFIPACAGNSSRRRSVPRRRSVHPRVCGEQCSSTVLLVNIIGSSPRVRGTGITKNAKNRRLRFIPACAGNRMRPVPLTLSSTVHPRVCGEQAAAGAAGLAAAGSSPRVRGTGGQCRAGPGKNRFIPACAGNSHRGDPVLPTHPVHPRVCGEQLPRPASASFQAVHPRVCGEQI